MEADGDCQDARQEVLIEESLVEVTYETERQCRVEMGQVVGAPSGTPPRRTRAISTSTTTCR